MGSKKLTKKQLSSFISHKYGEGIFSDAVDWVKDKAKKAHTYVKDNKLISRGLASYAESNPTSRLAGFAKLGSIGADYLGYGRKKYEPLKPAKMTGRGKKRGTGKTKLQMGILP